MSLRMPALASVTALLATLGLSSPLSATPPLGLACAPYADQTVCSGTLASFDGAPMDLDVTLPAPNTGTSHPLIILLHGFGNDKHEWESTSDAGDGADKYQWNSHWFAEHGYYVLAYTARGFRDSGGSGYEPATPGPSCGSACGPTSTIRVKNKDVEIRDTQWLAASVASAFPDLNPSEVAISGGSYGGGESWLQAASPTWTFPHDFAASKGLSLPVLTLQVAIPKYPWTDLSYALAPSGHTPTKDLYSAASGTPSTGTGSPFGVAKTSYIAGLYALGTQKGQFEEGSNLSPQNIPPDPETYPPTEPFSAWLARVDAGEPYSTAPRTDDPVVNQIRTAFAFFHSAYFQKGWATQPHHHEAAVYSISGWTDDLFPPVESFRMYQYLKSLDSHWPVDVYVADIGHSRAQNKPSTWRPINVAAFSFLQSQITGSHPVRSSVTSSATSCTDSPLSTLSASSPGALAKGTLVVRPSTPALLSPTSGAGDPDSLATDAIARGYAPSQVIPRSGCATSSNPPTSGYRAYSPPLPHPETTAGIQYVSAQYSLTTPGDTAVIAARLWDVSPDGKSTLVTRGVYRLDFLYGDPTSGSVKVPFYGDHWTLGAGHRIRLDLQQVDAPTYRPPSTTATLSLTGISLVLPVTGPSTVLPAS